MQGIENLFEAIKEQAPLEVLRDVIHQFDPHISEAKDKNGLDVLQHAIAVNNSEAVQYLLMRNYFTEAKKSPKCNNYMHLAASLDNVSALQVLLEHRPGDILKQSFVCYPDSCACLDSPGQEESGDGDTETTDEGMTPLDFAIRNGNVKSLKVLLQSRLMKCSSDSDLERACEINSPEAMKLLLTENPEDKTILAAFEQAVRKKLSGCMDCLLHHGVPLESAFRGLNCFHVMYQYSSSYVYQPNRALTTAATEKVGLLKATEVLVAHGLNINACMPRNTYPLYTILFMMFSEFCTKPDPQQVEVLELLLRAGADPNFDENVPLDEMGRSHIPVAYGRDSYSSALHAVQFDVFFPGATFDYAGKVLKLLFKYGANPYKVCSKTNLLPLEHFLDKFCDVDYDDYMIIQEDSTMEMTDIAKAVSEVISVYYLNMSLPKFQKAIVQSNFKGKLETFDLIGNVTIDALNMLCGQPKSLNDLTKLAIWEALGRSALKLYKLQSYAPPALLKSVKRLFE